MKILAVSPALTMKTQSSVCVSSEKEGVESRIGFKGVRGKDKESRL